MVASSRAVRSSTRRSSSAFFSSSSVTWAALSWPAAPAECDRSPEAGAGLKLTCAFPAAGRGFWQEGGVGRTSKQASHIYGYLNGTLPEFNPLSAGSLGG